MYAAHYRNAQIQGIVPSTENKASILRSQMQKLQQEKALLVLGGVVAYLLLLSGEKQ
jgi:hypothetical protein